MRVKLWLISILFIATVSSLRADLPHRPPAISGTWYSSNPAELRTEIHNYLQKAEAVVTLHPGETPVALIAPHAGYTYSGLTAAKSYIHLKGISFKRAIIVGPSHRASFRGASIASCSAYDTPLGSIFLDRVTCDRLCRDSLVNNHPRAHEKEHNIEIQLPFLQVLQPDIKIVPILLGTVNETDRERLADLLLPLLDDETILIMSSDFTHFGSNFNYVPFASDIPASLEKYARTAADAIVALDSKRFLQHCRSTGDTICGRNGIAVGIDALSKLSSKKKIQGYLQAYSNSSALTGDWSHAVSYLSIVFTDPPASTPSKKDNSRGSPFSLTETEKETLLKLARYTLEQYFILGKAPLFPEEKFTLTNLMKTSCGVFVTLTRNERLRGCIGYVVPVKPIYESVMEMVINAAVHDRRFRPVKSGELDQLRIEISVLSPLSVCTDLDSIEVGVHGLVIQQGSRSGLLLPQVPVEWGWDRKEYLKQICYKAGLPLDAYRSADANVYTFTAEVFHEEE